MKKIALYFLVLILVSTSLACNLGGKTDTQDETNVNINESPENAAQQNTNELEPSQQAPLEQENPTEEVEPQASLASGVQPGMYAFVNSNVVRDVTVYNEVIYAATLGGLVTWRLDSGYSMQYTPLDGMGHISANSITFCEIPQPRILVGTLTGISIYDPSTGLWEKDTLTPADSKISTSRIERLFCDQANNRLIVGYHGVGILDLNSGEFQRYTTNEGLLWNAVTDIAVNGQDIWIASGYKGIAQIANGTVTTFNLDNGMPDERAYALEFANDGTLWVGASSGIMAYKSGQWTMYGSESNARLSDINEIEISSEGNIWAATAPLGIGRLCQFNPSTATCDTDYQERDSQGILALTLTDTGMPVYGTRMGVYKFSDNEADPQKTSDQLASNYVDSFALGADGSLWIGTDGGVHVIDPANPEEEWQTYQQRENPNQGGNWASSIVVAPDGTAWMTFINGRASRYQNGEWNAYSDIYSYNSVTVDQQNRAWFGDDGKGIIVLSPDGNQVMQWTTANGLPGDNVQALLTDTAGVVWIGTNQGLAKFENETLQIVFGADSAQLPNKYIRALAIDPQGALLIGTFTGIARYDGSQVETLIDFLTDGFNQLRLTTLAISPSGEIWAGTDNGLLHSSDESTWELMTTKEGLFTNYISALIVDQYGGVWVGGGGSNFDGGGILHIVP